jgi:hypothetical protein
LLNCLHFTQIEWGVHRSTSPEERAVSRHRHVHLLRHQQRHRTAHLQGRLLERRVGYKLHFFFINIFC